MTVLETLQFAQTCQVQCFYLEDTCTLNFPCNAAWPPFNAPFLSLHQTGLVAENFNFVSQIQAAILSGQGGQMAAEESGGNPALPLDTDEGQFLRLLEEVRPDSHPVVETNRQALTV